MIDRSRQKAKDLLILLLVIIDADRPPDRPTARPTGTRPPTDGKQASKWLTVAGGGVVGRRGLL
jgi:hypothetical protein